MFRPLNPFFAVGAKNMDFLIFANFSKTEKFRKYFFGSEEAP
jgi:hypothetical protein